MFGDITELLNEPCLEPIAQSLVIWTNQFPLVLKPIGDLLVFETKSILIIPFIPPLSAKYPSFLCSH